MKEKHLVKNPNGISRQGVIMRETIARFTAEGVFGQSVKSGDFRKHVVERPWKVPEGYALDVIQGRNCRLELLQSEERDDSRILLQLHGGGYVGAMRNVYRKFAVLYNELGKGMDVLTVDYRVAPEYPFPAALEDSIYAYNWLINRGWHPNEILLAGDSAGGGLAMALCLYLKKQNRELPGGLIAMSPWTDMTQSGESYEKNYHLDPNFGNSSDTLINNKEYIGGNDPKNPFLSPAFGDFSGFPPMLIQVGSYEMLLSDSEIVASKAKEAGVKVRFSIYEGMFHVFQMALHRLPESKKAWAEVGHFLDVIKRS